MSNVSTTPSVLSNLTTISSAVNSLLSTSTPLNNQTTPYALCLLTRPRSTCRLAEFTRVLAYLLLAVSLLPQIVHLFHHGSRYIAGISYLWIIVRFIGLAALLMGHIFQWSSIFESIALICTVIIFVQILIYSDNLYRQQKIILASVTIISWLIAGGLILFFKDHSTFLTKFGHFFLALHMLPQILLNSILRTAKAISKFSMMFLALSDTLLFASFYTVNEHFAYLVATYYAFSFFLFIYIQTLVYSDAHIHLISRSAHTVLTPGVDIFTGLDANGAQSSGQEPQMFSIDDLESPDGANVVYQPVTSNKSSQPPVEQTPTKRFVWYATLASIFAIETVLTMMLIFRAWTPWIIFVPISIPLILGFFYLLRMKLNILQIESLRKIL